MITDSNLTPTARRLREVAERHGMTHTQLARYLGVPQGTLNNWLRGVREPHTSALRLLEVYAMLEVLAPGIHASFIPPRKRRGARPRAEATHPAL